MYKTLLTSLENGIFTITVNRPDKMNAINRDVMSDLDLVFNEVENNAAIRAVILTGAGQKAFVAGADISEFLGLTTGQGMDMGRRGQIIFVKIEDWRQAV